VRLCNSGRRSGEGDALQPLPTESKTEMPSRRPAEAIVRIYQAFLRKRAWRQVDLARELKISVEGLRKRLIELVEAEMPLTSHLEHPHVVWSVPANWLPGGFALDAEDVLAIVRVLLRAPRSTERDLWVRQVLGCLPKRNVPPGIPKTEWVPEENVASKLVCIEEAQLRRVALHIRYHSRGHAEPTWRHVSVQNVTPTPQGLFAALCHRDAKLKWFRVDRVYDAVIAPGVWWREATTEQVQPFQEESLHGFREGPAEDYYFVVYGRDAEWVRGNLPARGDVVDVPEGIRVHIRTGGPSVLARFIAGLGESARAETESLAVRVRAIAEGSVRAHLKT
jgi:predicted DNA-binding transcriptional regulator YafY